MLQIIEATKIAFGMDTIITKSQMTGIICVTWLIG